MISTDIVKNADYLHIIFAGKVVEYMQYEECSVTFGDVIEIAKFNGYDKGVIILIAESALKGTVYKYGNHGKYWEEVGETMGFA